MLKFECVPYNPESWGRVLAQFEDRTLYQSPAWLAFLADTQGGNIVTAALRDENLTVGYFCGLLVRKYGLRLLGSPLPGWTTSYMGFNLRPEVPRLEALRALNQFAFGKVGCVHFELMDCRLACDLVESCPVSFRQYRGFEIDLSQSTDDLFSRMEPSCRRCIRKAVRSGVIIEQANDDEFAADYYAQLQDVFAKQGLTPTYGIERVRALIRHLRPTGNLLLLRARDPHGRPIATAIFPAMHDRAYFWGAASWRPYQILRPNELLLWHAMLYWKARGIRAFDMSGGGDYKRKYGGREIRVPWLRASRYPGLPALRGAAAAYMRIRQRVGSLCNSSAVRRPSVA